MKLLFRIRAKYSLRDLDPPLIQKRLTGLPGIREIRVSDDRASDATHVTVVVLFVDTETPVLVALQRALLRLPKMIPYIIDHHGDPYEIQTMNPMDFLKYGLETKDG